MNKKKSSIFNTLDKILLPQEVAENFFAKNIMHIVVLFFITILYILNTHLYDKHSGVLSQLHESQDVQKVEYNLLQAELICYTKKSQITEMLAPYNIEIPETPPFVIIK